MTDSSLQTLAQELGRPIEHIQNVVTLIDEGATIPFIARYRKELHGSMDDQLLRELADRLHSAPPTIAASLKALERQGYVERRTDQRDTRRNRVAITRKGRDALAQGMDAFLQVDAHLYHGFSPEEREQVRQFHRRMLANLYQIGGDREAGATFRTAARLPSLDRCEGRCPGKYGCRSWLPAGCLPRLWREYLR